MGVVGVRTACWETVGVAFAACASFHPVSPSVSGEYQQFQHAREGAPRGSQSEEEVLRLYVARAQRRGNDRGTQLSPLWQGVHQSPAVPLTEAFRALIGLRPRSAEVKLLM